MQHQKSAKPRATPTKIVERRPVPLASNKNLNNVKKQPPPNRNSTLPQADQVERNRRIMLSDTSRLSRNISKDDRTDNGEDESSHR